MKTIILILTTSVISYPCLILTDGFHSKSKSELEKRLTRLEEQMKSMEDTASNNQAMDEMKLTTINQQLSKLENKFDSYFLWGYGTLIALILTILGNNFWMRKKVVNTS